MILKFLLEKEFKQLFRNSFLPRLIVVFPCMILLVLPWAANLEIRNIDLLVVDKDCSSLSKRFIHKIEASDYFRLKGISASYDEAILRLEKGEADAVCEISRQFEEKWIRKENPDILVAVNAVNGTKGSVALSYIRQIIADYAEELALENATSKIVPKFTVNVHNRYNPHLNYKIYMLPALMVTLLTMLCGFLPALNVVSEKERGTIEQINVTPVGRWIFILGKMIPYWIIGFVVLTLGIVLSGLVYGLFPAGSLVVLYLLSIVFVLAIAGLGLIISNYSATMQQAMFVIFFCMLIFILMSGMFTPVESMPQWAQFITIFNPLKYLVQVMRAIYLKGAGLADLSVQAGALLAFATRKQLAYIINDVYAFCAIKNDLHCSLILSCIFSHYLSAGSTRGYRKVCEFFVLACGYGYLAYRCLGVLCMSIK